MYFPPIHWFEFFTLMRFSQFNWISALESIKILPLIWKLTAAFFHEFKEFFVDVSAQFRNTESRLRRPMTSPTVFLDVGFVLGNNLDHLLSLRICHTLGDHLFDPPMLLTSLLIRQLFIFWGLVRRIFRRLEHVRLNTLLEGVKFLLNLVAFFFEVYVLFLVVEK